ncbi:MAG: peptide-N4-(N-acetyl-beta- glucosaminyl)asparagine amidase [Pleopsidium flavum]|nr:MAG: peptide-N4-(N-acetyl-beta- glucosaminyl)asparagine amidase [Pleopsidium flavum]
MLRTVTSGPFATATRQQTPTIVCRRSVPTATAGLRQTGQPHILMFKKKKGSWPDPGLSIGRSCYNNSSGGYCWEAVGPVRDAFNEVSEKIRDLFQSQSDYLDEGEEDSPTFSYGIWMIGRDKAHATPTIVLGCKSASVRTRAKNILKGSGILSPFPGIALKKTVRTPEPLAAGDASKSVALDTTSTIYAFGGPTEPCGTSIFLGSSDVQRSASRREATMGGIIAVDGLYYGLTVAHVFASDFRPPEGLAQGDFLDLDSDSESDGESLAEITSEGEYPDLITSSWSYCTTNQVTREQGAFLLRRNSALFKVNIDAGVESSGASLHPTAKQTIIELGVPCILLQSNENCCLLDCALFEIDSGSLLNGNRISVPSPTEKEQGKLQEYLYPQKVARLIEDGNVLVATGRAGVIQGYISETPAFIRMPGSKTFQKMWPVNLQKPLGKPKVFPLERV